MRIKNILVVGGGLIGRRHVEAVADHPRCSLVGLVDPEVTLDGVASFASMAEVSEPVDGVILATPTGLHGTHGAEAAGRGWPMLIEKPVTETLAQADALAAVLAEQGVASLVGHHRRYHNRVERLKQAVEDGTLGQVATVSLIWAQKKPDDYFAGNWRTTGGSPVLINIVHDLDLLRYVVGEITALAALPGASRRGGTRVETGAVALRFASGAVGTIAFTDTAPSPWAFEAGTGENPNIGTTGQDMLWVTGTAGSVAFPSLTLWQGAQDWSEPARPDALTFEPDTSLPLVAQLEHFLDVIEGTAPPRLDVADARQSLAAALAVEAQLTAEHSDHRSLS